MCDCSELIRPWVKVGSRIFPRISKLFGGVASIQSGESGVTSLARASLLQSGEKDRRPWSGAEGGRLVYRSQPREWIPGAAGLAS
jgi:hypothetical protein